jgi:hypothetical protein
MTDNTDKFKDLVLFYESDFIPMGTGAIRHTRSLLIKIQQATPKSPINVCFQEMYRTRDCDDWKYGRHNISIPVEVYVNQFDPDMISPIGRKIAELGLAKVDPQGDMELHMISKGGSRLYRLSMVAHPEVLQAWTDYFTSSGLALDLIEFYVDRIKAPKVVISPELFQYMSQLQDVYVQIEMI